MKQGSFNGRAFTALLLLFSFIVLFVTGVVLYIVPRTRTARAIDWTLMLLDKADWSLLHIAFGVVFVLAGIGHILLNRRPLTNYLRRKWQERRADTRPRGPRLELLVAALLTVLLVVAAIRDIPPISSLATWHEQIRDLWEPSSTDGQGRGGR